MKRLTEDEKNAYLKEDWLCPYCGAVEVCGRDKVAVVRAAGKLEGRSMAYCGSCETEWVELWARTGLDDSAMDNVECHGCKWSGDREALVLPISNLLARVFAGEVMPAGECPKCRDLAYLIPGR